MKEKRLVLKSLSNLFGNSQDPSRAEHSLNLLHLFHLQQHPLLLLDKNLHQPWRVPAIRGTDTRPHPKANFHRHQCHSQSAGNVGAHLPSFEPETISMNSLGAQTSLSWDSLPSARRRIPISSARSILCLPPRGSHSCRAIRPACGQDPERGLRLQELEDQPQGFR